jgi:hypothetical protein
MVDEGNTHMPAKKKSSKGHKQTQAKAKKRIASASKKPAAKRGTARAKKSGTTPMTKPRRNRIANASPENVTSGTTSVPQPAAGTRSARLLAEVALQVFTGVVRISGNQSILNGILLIRAGVADFPSAMGAATQYLLNAGIGDGDNISVAGVTSSVHYGGRTINVIVMTSAQKS